MANHDKFEIDYSRFDENKPKETPRERAARAAELAEGRLGGLPTKGRERCPYQMVYGTGVDGKPCPACDKEDKSGHALPACGQTQKLAARLKDIMLDLHRRKASALAVAYPLSKEEALDDKTLSDKASAALKKFCFKAARKDTKETGGGSDEVNDELEDEVYDEDSLTEEQLKEYVVGVMESLTPTGQVEYYVACSGLKNTNLYWNAFKILQKQMRHEGMTLKNGYTHPAVFEGGSGAVENPRLPRFPASGQQTVTDPLTKVSNLPGTCAAAKLVQRAIAERSVPYCMAEVWYTPDSNNSGYPDTERTGQLAPSCTTCKDNLPQMLCGLREAQRRLEQSLEVQARAWEAEEAERVRKEEEQRQREREANQRAKKEQERRETMLVQQQQSNDETWIRAMDSVRDLKSQPPEDKMYLAGLIVDRTNRPFDGSNSLDNKRLANVAKGGKSKWEASVEKFFDKG